jgi:hypothetical protein
MADGITRLRNEQGSEYSTGRGVWARALVIAHQYGWRPELLRMSYLAPATVVSAEDARNMRRAFDRLFELALSDPARVFPIPVDIGELDRLRQFVGGGEFDIGD